MRRLATQPRRGILRRTLANRGEGAVDAWSKGADAGLGIGAGRVAYVITGDARRSAAAGTVAFAASFGLPTGERFRDIASYADQQIGAIQEQQRQEGC